MHVFVDQVMAEQRHGQRRPWRGRGRGRPPNRRRDGQAPHGDQRLPVQPKFTCFSRDELQHLANAETAEVVRRVYENEAGYLATYKNKSYCSHPLGLKRLIKTLHRLMTSDDKELAARMLAQILSEDGEYATFLFHLDTFLKKIPFERSGRIREENPQYLRFLLDIGMFVVECIPKTVANTFPILQLQLCTQRLFESNEIPHTFSDRMSELSTQFEESLKYLHPKSKADCNPTDVVENPPELYTEISILPDPEEINSSAWKPFLRPNKTSGAYTNWDHYLDVQFRLLREDFIGALRNGICQHRDGLTGRKLSDVRVYENAQVLEPVCLFSGIGFQIRFSVAKLSRVNWEHSRRLIFGSLLCLSTDDFDTVIFATVVKREPKLLREGLVTIKFEGAIGGFEIDPSIRFTMVESTAYFEAYRHVLEGLQQISHHCETMPFKPCIVDCKLITIQPPHYIRSLETATFDLSTALDCRSQVALMDLQSWPSAEATCLDTSQYEALKMALTQEISVIQGPPGTGKTFIGLKLIEVLLHNRHVWDRQKTAPIFVVCYTNHALDQFLEGILDTTLNPKIIRIGGRCKSDRLANCVLKEVVHTHRSNRTLPKALHSASRAARNEMFELKGKIEAYVKNLESKDGKVLSLQTLNSAISEDHSVQLAEAVPTEVGKEMDVWLNLWQPQMPQMMENRSSEPVFEQDAPAVNVFNADVDEDYRYVEVDNEARILEEERMLEGEEIELKGPSTAKDPFSQQPLPPVQQVHPDSDWQVVQISDKRRKQLIRKAFSYSPMRESQAKKVKNIWALSESNRWRLYHYWVSVFLKDCKAQLSTVSNHYSDTCEKYAETQEDINVHVARNADVIGMTTTGAAKQHYIFKRIHPKIIVIEEAAEVFEAHILTTLSPSVQQLVLIGDHKQLRPKPTNYELEKKYALDVSLFERLASNGIPYAKLETQHRMRPEIAKLICPLIYERLLNHESVKHYGHVLGVGKDVFFMHHEFPERSHPDGDMTSHSNYHEARFIISLCKYLLKQGYGPGQITVLTMYRGQLLELKNGMQRSEFQGVRVAAVDDFQGEENDIVLLSLVRSNSEGKIGFLRSENRMCVSLSRAKMGLYVIGNLSVFRSKDDTLWPQLLAEVEKQKLSGRSLPLYCQNHPEEKVDAQKPEDFSKCPEGGCQKLCATRLACGHTCTRMCHPYDKQHALLKCTKRCSKPLACGHKCGDMCAKCTTSNCAPCKEMVEKKIVKCGHIVKMACSKRATQSACTLQCKKEIPCGHLCQELCSNPCTIKCNVSVSKDLPCGHKANTVCSSEVSQIVCTEPCTATLSCGHSCAGTCGDCNKGRLHVQCQHKCGRNLECGHICNFPCTPNCPPCLQPCANYCIHSHCPRKCYEPCDPCSEPCEWQCQHLKCTQNCGEFCNRVECNHPCPKQLSCGHDCVGLCGEICICRICNQDEVSEMLFGTEDEADAKFIELAECGHILEVGGLDHWMKQSQENSDGEGTAVQLPQCPKCKTPIYKSLRFGNIVKQTLADIDAIKRKKLIISANELRLQFKVVQSSMKGSVSYHFIESDLDCIRRCFEEKRFLFPHRMNTIKVQLECIPHLVKVLDILARMKQSVFGFSAVTMTTSDLKSEVHFLKQCLMQQFLSQQQLSDIKNELRRLLCAVKVCDLQFKIDHAQVKLKQSDRDKLAELALLLHESGWRQSAITEDDETSVLKAIEDISRTYRVAGLAEKEKLQIVELMGLPKGHWFKCPNGHFYCIADCGGAMETSKCPDCKATIGGENHALAAGNELAPEIDGARYSAWSEAANMENYDL